MTDPKRPAHIPPDAVEVRGAAADVISVAADVTTIVGTPLAVYMASKATAQAAPPTPPPAPAPQNDASTGGQA